MARAKARKPKTSGVTEFPAPPIDSKVSDAAVSIEEPSETPPEATKAPEPPRKSHGRREVPMMLTFFQQLAKIPLADWGTRAKIRVYRLEPIIDMRRGSANKYICIYTEPVDEERIKRDHGSGRYRLFLNIKAPGGQEEKETDSVEFDILDRNFPPVIPEGSWVNDPINKKWAWAKPESAPTVSASGNMLEAVQVLGEIQDRAEERAEERMKNQQAPGWDPAQQLKAVSDVAKDLASALKATPENPIPAFISEQMTSMRAELAAQRERSDKLMDRLLDAAKVQPAPAGGMSAIKELLAGVKELLPDLQGLFPKADEAIADRVGRSRMSGWQEFFAPILPKLVEALAPIMPAVAAGWMGGGNQNPPMPAQPRPLPSPGMTPPAPPQAGPNLDAMLLNALTNDRNGEDFADSLVTLFGQQGQLMYKQACSLGEQGLLSLIQQRPVWNQLGPLQAKVPEFIHEFIAYGQEQESEPPPQGAEQPPAMDAEVVDLTGATQ